MWTTYLLAITSGYRNHTHRRNFEEINSLSFIQEECIPVIRTSPNNTRRGLPLTRSRVEQIFPKLTQAQIRRITARGQMRAIQRGEILYEQGDTSVPFFVVVSGEFEVVRPLGTAAVDPCQSIRVWSIHWRSRHTFRPPNSLPSPCN